MKRLLILLSFILATVASFGQYINNPTVGSATSLYHSKGGLIGDSSLIISQQIFADTTAANFSVVSKYSGTLIQVAGGQIWHRTLTPNQWHLFATSTGGAYVLVSDTSVMLLPYLLKSDTAYMLSTRVKYSDTANQMSGYLRKNWAVLYTDTASMLSQLLRISDTANMLDPYVRNDITINTNAPLFGGGDLSTDRTFGIDTGRSTAQIPTGGDLNQVRDSLVLLISGGGFGTVLSVSTTDGVGIISSVANPTSTPNISLRVDTLAISTRLWRQKGIDSVMGQISLKVNISDTSNMLDPYLRKTDTATMLSPFVQYSDTSYMLSNRLKISDTAYMLSNRLKISDTTYMLSNRLKISDTTTMLARGWLSNRSADSILVLRTLINTKGTGTVTSVGLTAPSFLTITNSPITTSGNIVATLANQTANTFFRGPTTGSPAQPVFGAIVAADLPDSYLPISDTAAMLAGYKTYYPRTSLSHTTGFANYNSSTGVITIPGSTSDISEGSNLYYTDGRARASLSAGTGISYNSSTGVITNSSPSLGGTVTSVATNNGTGINGGTITSTGTLSIDTLNISTRLNRQKGTDSVMGQVSLKVNISDTANMLSGYTRLIRFNDSLNAIRGRINGAGTLATSAQPNITSVGTLINLTVTGTGSFGGAVTGASGGFSGIVSGSSFSGQSITLGFSSNNTSAITITQASGLKNTYIGSAFGATFLQNNNFFNGSAYVFPDNTAPSATLSLADGVFSFQTGAAGVDPSAKTIMDISGNWVMNGTVKSLRIIGNSGTDNTIDAVQSGGGSMLSNLYRMEGKIQATSTTIDATATVWNDNTNGSTVTYTLPSTSSLQGGKYMFIKSGTGNLTLSGTIIKKDGTSAGGSMTLASTDGMQQFWFDGTTWYQIN